jgi:hypothetical protein
MSSFISTKRRAIYGFVVEVEEQNEVAHYLQLESLLLQRTSQSALEIVPHGT